MLIQKQYNNNFIGNLNWPGQIMFSIIEEAKEVVLDFSQGLVNLCYDNIILV